MYGQHGHIGAVNALQQQIGRRLDIVHTYLRQPAVFPTASDLAWVRQGSMLLVSWALNDSKGIAAGEWDASIRQRAQEFKALGKPMFLEWRWEMDRPEPAASRSARPRLRRGLEAHPAIFAEQHVTNVAWVWCPRPAGSPAAPAQAYYPGNGEVDWVCADTYPGPGRAHHRGHHRPFLTWAAAAPEADHDRRVRGPQTYGAHFAQWLRGAEQSCDVTVRSRPSSTSESNATQTSRGVEFGWTPDPGASSRHGRRTAIESAPRAVNRN